MIGGAKGIGIGLDFGIGNQSRPKGSGKYLDPAVKEALCGIWIADQNTNESPTRNIIKNKIANAGGDFEILNAAYKLNSGYGKYETDFSNYNKDWGTLGGIQLTQTSFIVNNNSRYSLIFREGNPNAIDIEGYEVDIVISKIGSAKKSISYYYYDEQGNRILLSINKSGRVSVPKSYVSKGTTWVGWYVEPNVVCSITQIPDYQGAFVTDGVDDLIVSKKSISDMLGGSNEITVVSMIHQIELNSTYSKGFTNYIENIDSITSYVRTQSNVAGKTGIYGYTYNNATQLLINNILGDKNDYEKSLANATNILSNSKFNVAGGINNTNLSSQVAWYWTLIAKRALTTNEINQVIAYYNLDKYVAPDIYYDVKKQGLTNENHTEFRDKLIDYSGNGHDMQLYNFGWKLDSGIGKYEVDFTVFSNRTNVVSINDNKIVLKPASNCVVPYANLTDTYRSWKGKVTFNSNDSAHNLSYDYREADGKEKHFIITKSGEYSFPDCYKTETGEGTYGGFFNRGNSCVTIEQLPSFEGALVFDGVNDYGQYVGNLGLKDYTVVADRAYVELKNNGVPFITSIESNTNTPFLFEFALTDSNRPYSFGDTTILPPLELDRSIKYQSTYVYNGNTISKGTNTNTGDGLTFGRFGGNTQYAKLCLYNFMLFPYSLSEFLIERQLKKRKLGTLHPEINNK